MFYLITYQQAEALGEFTFEGIKFNPFARPQKNDLFLLPFVLYEALKTTNQFLQIDWSNVPTTNVINDSITLYEEKS